MRHAKLSDLVAALALTLALATSASGQQPAPPTFGAGIDVIARSLYLDVLDSKGRPVEEIPAGSLRLLENGVERPILEIRRRVDAPTATETVSPLPVPPRPAALPPQRFVLLALDPATLGRVAWEKAIADLGATAETFTRLGPVDVTILTDPPVRFAVATRDPEEVKRALARAFVEVKPRDEFFGGRSRFIAEMERIFELRLKPLGTGRNPEGEEVRQRDPNADRVLQAEFAARELAVEERRLLDRSVGRLREAASAIARPLVAVWATQGDPDTPGFVLSLLPDWVSNQDRIRFQGRPLGTSSQFERIWGELAADGVTLVPWSRNPEALLEISSPTVSHSARYRNRPSLALGAESLTLFQIAAERTGGELVQSESELRVAAERAGGRHELVYQSDDASEGWRDIRLEATTPGWTVRVAPRVYVLASDARAADAEAPDLWVDVAATRAPAPRPGREIVTLSALVDLAPLQRRLPAGTPLRFDIRYRATPPDGEALLRSVSLPVPALPADGDLRYQVSLDVPVGTHGYALAVREESTGAAGRVGPVEVYSGTVESAPPPAAEAAASQTTSRPAELRFFEPPPGGTAAADLRLVWKTQEQRLLHLAGGSGSPLEVGLVLDGAERLRREREAFARAAAGGLDPLLGDDDRLFRVDLGATPLDLGAARGGPAGLLARTPPAPAEPTAILDGIGFALGRFAGSAERQALIVLTDGCDGHAPGAAERITALARARAVPVLVVLVDARPCPPPPLPPKDRKKARESRPRADAAVETTELVRAALRELAEGSGGIVFELGEAELAGAVWSDVEAALARLRVVRFEPSTASVQPAEVEVRTARGERLRPGG